MMKNPLKYEERDERIKAIKSMLNPRSIALVGASPEFMKIGGLAFHYMYRYVPHDKLYPVNPKRNEISGLKCYPSVKEIPGDVDLACIAIPSPIIPRVLEECAEKSIKGVIIFASGFAEAGGKGEELQDKITEIARKGGMYICGPNAEGVVSPVTGTYATFTPCLEREPLSGEIALLTQSGALGGSIMSRMWERGVGISHWISSGNEGDLETADYIKFLAQDPHTKVIVSFLEGVKDGKKFREAAEMAAEAKKPIVMFKTGRSKKGKMAVRSHTGALAGSEHIYDAIFKQLGIIRADGLEELYEIAMALAWQPLPSGNKAGIISCSGGACSIYADLCETFRLEVPNLTDETRGKIRENIPPFVKAGNPLDVGALVFNMEALNNCIKAMMSDDHVDMLLFMIGGQAGEHASMLVRDGFIKALTSEWATESGKPALGAWMMADSYVPMLKRLFYEKRIPLYACPRRTTRVAKAMVEYSDFLKKRGLE